MGDAPGGASGNERQPGEDRGKPIGHNPCPTGKPVRRSIHDISDWKEDMVWIGRALPERGLTRSAWANPFRAGKDGNRQRVISRCCAHFHQEGLHRQLYELGGKVLVCACRRDQACHGDVIILEWEKMLDKQGNVPIDLKRARGDGGPAAQGPTQPTAGPRTSALRRQGPAPRPAGHGRKRSTPCWSARAE